VSITSVCQQCFQDFKRGSHYDGFCSDDCREEYELQLVDDDEEEDGDDTYSEEEE